MIFVPDASSVLASIFPDERGGQNVFDLFREARVVAPSIWPAELANALLVGVRRKRLDGTEALAALALIGRFEIELVTESVSDFARSIYPLAHKHGLTAYDALYLHVALSRNATLVSFHAALLSAARQEGVEVV